MHPSELEGIRRSLAAAGSVTGSTGRRLLEEVYRLQALLERRRLRVGHGGDMSRFVMTVHADSPLDPVDSIDPAEAASESVIAHLGQAGMTGVEHSWNVCADAVHELSYFYDMLLEAIARFDVEIPRSELKVRDPELWRALEAVEGADDTISERAHQAMQERLARRNDKDRYGT